MADVQTLTNKDLVSYFAGFNDLLEKLGSDAANNFVTEYFER